MVKENRDRQLKEGIKMNFTLFKTDLKIQLNVLKERLEEAKEDQSPNVKRIIEEI
jgi:hypothetical protein